MELFRLLCGVAIIGVAVWLIVRRVEVRLVLLGAGLLMVLIAGQPLLLFDTFAFAMVYWIVAPICAALGFAAVLTATGCDRHLVHLLIAPLRSARWAVLPGGILAAYVVNLALPSQTSTAAALGPVLVPLMIASGLPAVTAGAALVLGASFGGDLLSPAAGDLQVLAAAGGFPASAISARLVPASLLGMAAAALVFTLRERGRTPAAPEEASEPAEERPAEIHVLKALVPLVPVALLLGASALEWRLGQASPLAWLLAPPALPPDASPREAHEWARLAGALPVVRAMLIGALVAAAAAWRELTQVTRSLFEGMGTAYGTVISLTITAQCFGAGIKAVGISAALLRLLDVSPLLAPLLAGGFPWALAVLTGSGSGPVQTFASTVLQPIAGRPDAPTLAAVAALAAAFGRTMSPVAAVVVYTSGLVGVPPVELVRRHLPSLLVGAAVALAVVLVWPG